MLFAVKANCSTLTRTSPSVVEQRDELVVGGRAFPQNCLLARFNAKTAMVAVKGIAYAHQ